MNIVKEGEFLYSWVNLEAVLLLLLRLGWSRSKFKSTHLIFLTGQMY